MLVRRTQDSFTHLIQTTRLMSSVIAYLRSISSLICYMLIPKRSEATLKQTVLATIAVFKASVI
jgi:hypothetical protein